MTRYFDKAMLSSLVALALVSAPGAAFAQTSPAPASPAQVQPVPGPATPQSEDPEPAEFPQAIRLLAIMNAAFADNNVNELTKNKLFSCLFFNSLQALNKGVQQTFRDNPELSFDNNSHLFRVATAVCGVTQAELTQPNPSAPGAVQPQQPQGQQQQNPVQGR